MKKIKFGLLKIGEASVEHYGLKILIYAVSAALMIKYVRDKIALRKNKLGH